MKERIFERSYVVDDFGNTHDSIKDTVNGLTVCTDVDEDYESLILCLPEMYAELERDVIRITEALKMEGKLVCQPLNDELERKVKLLAKARGESNE